MMGMPMELRVLWAYHLVVGRHAHVAHDPDDSPAP